MFERLNCIEQIEGVARSIAFDRISVTPAQFRSRGTRVVEETSKRWLGSVRLCHFVSMIQLLSSSSSLQTLMYLYNSVT